MTSLQTFTATGFRIHGLQAMAPALISFRITTLYSALNTSSINLESPVFLFILRLQYKPTTDARCHIWPSFKYQPGRTGRIGDQGPDRDRFQRPYPRALFSFSENQSSASEGSPGISYA